MKHKAGFTLIEVLIYMVIFSLLVGTMMLFAFAMLSGAQRTDMQIEVTDNARFATQKLQRIIQGAVSVNSPAVGSSSTSLSLTTATASWNPFVIDVASGSLRFKKGSAEAIPITNGFVTISSVSFKNYSFSTSTKNTIHVKANVSSVGAFSTASP